MNEASDTAGLVDGFKRMKEQIGILEQTVSQLAQKIEGNCFTQQLTQKWLFEKYVLHDDGPES